MGTIIFHAAVFATRPRRESDEQRAHAVAVDAGIDRRRVDLGPLVHANRQVQTLSALRRGDTARRLVSDVAIDGSLHAARRHVATVRRRWVPLSLFNIVAQSSVSPKQIGVATSTSMFLRQIGSLMGVGGALYQPVVDRLFVSRHQPSVSCAACTHGPKMSAVVHSVWSWIPKRRLARAR